MKRDQGHQKRAPCLTQNEQVTAQLTRQDLRIVHVSHWFKHATWCREGRQVQFLSGIQIFSLSLLVIPWVPEVFSRV